MNLQRRLFLTVGAVASSAISGSIFVAGVARADQSALIACIKNYSELGISPDVALGECQKSSLANCVKQLVGEKFTATSIKKRSTANDHGSGLYLIDLGNEESRWMEGKQWREKGCYAFTKGPYKRQSDNHSSFWKSERSYEWFRQGWCNGDSIQLEQPYTLEEAKLRCELGYQSEPKSSNTIEPNPDELKYKAD